MGSTTDPLGFLFSLPVDWPIFGLVAALLALEAFSSGSVRTSTISIAFPITYILFQWLPSTFLFSTAIEQLNSVNPEALAAVFALVFIAMYFMVHRMIFSFGSAGGDVPEALISGFATTVILVLVWLQTPALMNLWELSSQVQLVFNETVRAWWLLGAFAALAYTRG